MANFCHFKLSESIQTLPYQRVNNLELQRNRTRLFNLLLFSLLLRIFTKVKKTISTFYQSLVIMHLLIDKQNTFQFFSDKELDRPIRAKPKLPCRHIG